MEKATLTFAGKIAIVAGGGDQRASRDREVTATGSGADSLCWQQEPLPFCLWHTKCIARQQSAVSFGVANPDPQTRGVVKTDRASVRITKRTTLGNAEARMPIILPRHPK